MALGGAGGTFCPALSTPPIYRFGISCDGLLEPRYTSSRWSLLRFWNIRNYLSACLARSLKRPSSGRLEGKNGSARPSLKASIRLSSSPTVGGPARKGRGLTGKDPTNGQRSDNGFNGLRRSSSIIITMATTQ